MSSKKTSSMQIQDGPGPYGLVALQPAKRNYVIEGPTEGSVAKRMRMNSQVNKADIYAITENSMDGATLNTPITKPSQFQYSNKT